MGLRRIALAGVGIATLGLGLNACSSPPSATAALRQKVEALASVVAEDGNLERLQCPNFAGKPTQPTHSYCGALVARTASDEARMTKADVAYERLELSTRPTLHYVCKSGSNQAVHGDGYTFSGNTGTCKPQPHQTVASPP
jgi:hypothetical protein